MFPKYYAFCIIFAICWCHITGSALQQYGIDVGVGTSTERFNAATRCVNINPQNSLDLDQIMGLWYGSEIIMHSQDFPGVYEYDSCVIIHLEDVTEQVQGSNNYNRGSYNYNSDYNNGNPGYNNNNYRRTQYQQYPTTSTTPQYIDNDDYLHQSQPGYGMKYLRLVWSESNNNLEYTFNYTTNAPGQWSNIGDQRGSLVTLNSYTQFTGTVQVVKAVNDHLVLTFCGNDIKSSIYTVVLTRNRLGLSADELRSIRNLLSRRGLYTETIRKVCNAANLSSSSISYSLLTLMVLLCAWLGRK